MAELGKTLLIIGAGREQIPAYELAHEMGLLVIGTDMNPDAPAFAHADFKLIASTRDANTTLKVVKEFNKTHKIDGVITIANDVPYTVAMVASELGLPGISVESAKYFLNKVEMKKCFFKYDIKTPDFISIPDKESFISATQQETFPMIIKPSDGRGARGVLYLDESIDLDWAYEHSIASCENKQLILEKYVEGPQLSVEGFFIKGKYSAIGYADRNYNNLEKTKPFVVEDGGQIPSRYEGKILKQIEKLIQDGAESLGISWGTLKADIVMSSEGPQIIELAGRLSGNYFATHHIPMAYGVDLVGSLIKTSMGQDIQKEDLMPNRNKFFGVRYFFPNEGVVKSITGIENVCAQPYCRFFDMFINEGDVQKVIDSHVQRAGVVICDGDDYETAKSRTEESIRKIKFFID